MISVIFGLISLEMNGNALGHIIVILELSDQ